MRGLAYVGVVEELESADVLADVEKVGGTSAGAIIALLIALDYSSDEILELLSATEFQSFNDGHFGAVRRIKNKFGWYKGEAFSKWLEEVIAIKTGNPEITFSDLKKQGCKDLYAVSTCVNQQKLLVLSYETYPEMKVKDAVRASMSIPLYFEAVFVDNSGKRYQNYHEGLDILVDGGIMGNYPIFLFDSVYYQGARKHRIADQNTLGFRIDSREQILQDSVTRKIAPQKIDSFKDYIGALYNYTMESANRNQLTEADWDRTISISSEGIGPVIRKFSEEEKQLLVASGRRSVSHYFDKVQLTARKK